MNFRLTMVLVIALLLITSLFVWLRTRSEVAPKIDDTPLNLVVSPQPKEIRAVSYLRDGQVQVAFARSAIVDPASAPRWNMTAPATAAAEGYLVNEIADSLRSLSYKEKFEPEPTGTKSEETTGVKSPRNVIEYSDDAGKKHTLTLGKRTVGGAYARLDAGKTIFLLQSNPLERLDRDAADFRSKVVSELSSETVSALSITTAGQTVELTRQPGVDGKWMITKPIPARANAAVVEAILSEMRLVRAVDFTSMTTDMPAVGLTPAAVTVTAFAVQSTPPSLTPATTSAPATAPTRVQVPIATLNIGYFTDPVQKKQLYAALGSSKEVFTVSADTFTHLNKPLNDLRDPAITPLSVSDAVEILVTPSDTKDESHNIALKSLMGQWSIANLRTPVRAGTAEVATLLTAIKNLRAIKFVDGAGNLKSIGLDPPVCTLTIRLPLQSTNEVLLIGKPETADKVTPVMRQGESTVYLVQTADIEHVLATTMSLRDKEMDHLTGDMVREISFAGPSAKPQSLVREGANWKLTVDGKSSTADEVKIVSLLSAFTPVTANKWLTTDSAPPAGTPDATISLSVMDLATPAASATTAPASMPSQTMGPVLPTTRTIKIWKKVKDISTTWIALYEGSSEPSWTFEPTPALIDAVTKGDFTPTTQPATQPAAAPGQPPAGLFPGM